jgi:hypothetical protein
MNHHLHRSLAVLSLVVAPLILAAIELFHPAHFTADPGMSAFLSHPQSGDPHFNAITYFGPEWWFLMHMIQTPLVVVVSFGLLYLTDSFGGAGKSRFVLWAWTSRVTTVVFMTYYTVLDAIGGIGLGRQLSVINEKYGTGVFSNEQADTIRVFLDHMWVDPWVGGVGSFVSLTGSWAVFVAAVTAAGYLILNRRTSWLVAILLAGFGWELQIAHASLNGPIAFSLLALASALHLTRKNTGSDASPSP